MFGTLLFKKIDFFGFYLKKYDLRVNGGLAQWYEHVIPVHKVGPFNPQNKKLKFFYFYSKLNDKAQI